MQKKEIIVEVTMQKRMVLEVEADESKEYRLLEMIYAMTPKQCKAFLTTGLQEIEAIEFDKGKIVKRAIDNFDPYGIGPNAGGPENEYYGRASWISDSIEDGMSVEEIADIIAEEFNFAFGSEYTRENCIGPAEEIHYFLYQA